MITKTILNEAYSYESYKELLNSLLIEGKTTGANQSEEYLNYAKINLQRMNRLDKTIDLGAELISVLSKLHKPLTWLIISEGWCGDAAQNLPILNLMAKRCENISLKIILRDEHLEIMDQYLSNGSRSIPKLICLESDSLKELFVWGPRPADLQTIVLDLLAQHVSKEEKGLVTQKWYTQNKTQSLQNEILIQLKKLI